MKAGRKKLSSGDYLHHARNPALVQKTSTERRKNGAAKIQRIKDDFFSDDSLRLFSSTLSAAERQMDGFQNPRRGMRPIYSHSFDLTFSLLERVENSLAKLRHKPLMKSLTNSERKTLTELRDNSIEALSKIVKYELPEGDLKTYTNNFGETIPRVFITHLNPSAIFAYQRRLELAENGNAGDMEDVERQHLQAAKDFNDLKSQDLREALQIPLEQVQAMANKVWFSLNYLLGETNHYKIVDGLYKSTSDSNQIAKVRSLMEKTLRGRINIEGARRMLERMYDEFKHGSFKVLTYSRAKLIAALKFSKIFLQPDQNKQALPESILVTGDRNKIFNISRSEDLPKLNRIGNMIIQRQDELVQRQVA